MEKEQIKNKIDRISRQLNYLLMTGIKWPNKKIVNYNFEKFLLTYQLKMRDPP